MPTIHADASVVAPVTALELRTTDSTAAVRTNSFMSSFVKSSKHISHCLSDAQADFCLELTNADSFSVY